MTHNGKIARLPRNVRDELNHRLDDGEPGGRIVEWLNALSPVQAVLAAEFGGVGINAQNLSNWRKGGFQHWLKQQQHRVNVQQLTEDSKELNTDAGGVEIANHLSAVLVAELVASARDALANITDPAERCVRVQEFLQTLARVRRQDNLAGKLAIERERRTRERLKEKEKDDYRRECRRESAPWARELARSIMGDSFASLNFLSQAQATEEAESLLRGVKLDGSRQAGSTPPDKPQSN